MVDVVAFTEGGYSFIPGGPQYSAGVCAAPGLSIERVRFSAPVTLGEAFEKIARVIEGAGGRYPRCVAANCVHRHRSRKAVLWISAGPISAILKGSAC